jgi:hypothetical protein
MRIILAHGDEVGGIVNLSADSANFSFKQPKHNLNFFISKKEGTSVQSCLLHYVHQVIGDSGESGLQQACKEFKAWVQKTYFS